jgi:flagellar hook-associated protein 3 FlgL
MRVNPYFVTNLVSALDDTQSSIQSLTSQLASGVRVNALGDDPVASGQNVVLLNQIQRDDTFTTTSSLVTGQLQVADSALGSIVSELTEAISLATSANNGTMSSSAVQTVAEELTGILGEVTALANSSYQGQYLFSGAQTTTEPFTVDTTTTPITVTYNGDDQLVYIKSPSGQSIQMNVPGDTIFQGSGANSVFGALCSLINDYSSGTVDTDQAVSDTEALNTALNYLSQQRVTIDNSITQLTAASNAITSQKTQLTVAQTNLMQADVASIATQLSLAESQQTALELVIVQLNSASNSLFSKL